MDVGFWIIYELLYFARSLDSAKRNYQFHMDRRYWEMRNRHQQKKVVRTIQM